MTDFEQDMDAVELSPETLEEAAGGDGGGKKLRITRNTNAYLLPGKESPVVDSLRSGTIIEHFHDGGYVDDHGVKWYKILRSHSSIIGYISSRCCEFI